MAIPIYPSEELPDGGGNAGPAGWGVVPTTGTVESAIPPAPDVPSATQAVQSSDAATLAVAQASFLPPAPTWSPMLDGSGFMTAPWVTWFQTLSRRAGGYISSGDSAQLFDAFGEVSRSGQAGNEIAAMVDAFQTVQVVPDQGLGLLADAFAPNPKRDSDGSELLAMLDSFPQGTHLTTWNDWNLSVSGAKVLAAGAPTWATWIGTLEAYQFAVNDSVMLESQEFLHDWKEGTPIHIHLHWTTGGLNDATPRGVKWQIEYTYANTDFSGAAYAFPATSTISAETTIPAGAADRSLIGTSIGVITPTGIKIGAQIMMRLKRIAAAGTAPAANPFALSLGIHYEIDTPGSRSIATK